MYNVTQDDSRACICDEDRRYDNDRVDDDLISERVHGDWLLETLGVSECITIRH